MVSTNKIILMINHRTYENRPGMDLMAWRCTLCCEPVGRYGHIPPETALLCLEWLHKSCNNLICPTWKPRSFCLHFRSPPPWAGDHLLRPRPDQGRRDRDDQRGGYWLSDVSCPPVHTPGHTGGEVRCHQNFVMSKLGTLDFGFPKILFNAPI